MNDFIKFMYLLFVSMILFIIFKLLGTLIISFVFVFFRREFVVAKKKMFENEETGKLGHCSIVFWWQGKHFCLTISKGFVRSLFDEPLLRCILL